MADVNVIPKIRCDNCGTIEDKVKDAGGKVAKPRSWGSCRLEGSKCSDSYGGKSRLDYPDLCPICAEVALEAAHVALKRRRESGFDGPTGAE